MRRPRAAVAGCLLTLTLAAGPYGCEVGEGAPGEIGAPAPEYAARTMDGDTVTLADLRGEAVLLNVWATWCPPCRVEMPHLQELHEELGERGLRIVGVSVDSEGAGRAVARFTGDLGIDFLILQDPGERIANAFGTYGVPANILIDPEGVVRWRHSGPVTADDPVLREVLEEVLPRSAEGAQPLG